MTSQRPACPHCGEQPIPIMYGYPANMAVAFEAERRGEIVIGGCVVDDDNPIWFCRACGRRYGRLGDLR
ncbi:hypothetical protein SAMN04489712_101293 [Thermomonospora echinospora]|uniref:Uncharacterized protein n=1 Tax=Thermomonospora echinospora TaxID=1992 RepID=A0A1H5SNH7_9ACTN|nr:hypothetical protein [Thermomonospora echinospora]SEF52129.1 hypothetical protein SAMN04489712_101293 [Thermomonospora echinospora]